MKIAIAVPAQWYSHDPSRFSIDLILYVQAARAMGHEALVICHEGGEYNVDFPVVAAVREGLEDPDFWRRLNLDIAIVFTWLHHAKIVEAARRAGVFVVSRGDTDGLFSIRQHPRLRLGNMLVEQRSLLQGARALKHWLNRYYRTYPAEEAEVIRSLSQAHVTLAETDTAQENIFRFLDYQDKSKLKAKVHVLPHLVSKDILEASLPAQKQERVVAIGRWDSPQKDGALLNKSLSHYLKSRPETEVILIGRGGERLFSDLQKRYPQVCCTGILPHSEIKQYLAGARILLFSSRWEGSPISGNEALCLGCSVVGPDIPGITGICSRGPYGRVAKSRAPHDLAAALEQEMQDWERGQRKAEEIARYWRGQCCGLNVMRTVIGLAGAEAIAQ